MKVSELIKQAEELLDKALSEPLGINTCLDEAEFDFYLFALNHMQEIIDKLQKYEEVLVKVSGYYSHNNDINAVFNIARKALEEE